jgi:hypothetical protein
MALDLQAQLDALREAYFSGATRVNYEGKSVDYRSLAEMRELIDSLQRQLGIVQPANVIAKPRMWR